MPRHIGVSSLAAQRDATGPSPASGARGLAASPWWPWRPGPGSSMRCDDAPWHGRRRGCTVRHSLPHAACSCPP